MLITLGMMAVVCALPCRTMQVRLTPPPRRCILSAMKYVQLTTTTTTTTRTGGLAVVRT
jgi:hypothetical protein